MEYNIVKMHQPAKSVAVLNITSMSLFFIVGLKSQMPRVKLMDFDWGCAVVLVAGACVSSVPTRWAKYHALFSGAFLLIGGTAVIVALPLVAPTHQSARRVFLDFDIGDVAANGLPNVAYMFLIGTLMPQGTFIGFEL